MNDEHYDIQEYFRYYKGRIIMDTIEASKEKYVTGIINILQSGSLAENRELNSVTLSTFAVGQKLFLSFSSVQNIFIQFIYEDERLVSGYFYNSEYDEKIAITDIELDIFTAWLI